MNVIKIILLIPQLMSQPAQADTFSIGAFGCTKLAQADSCYFNMALFWYDDQDSVNRRLKLAEKSGMRIILARAKTPETPDITGISGGQRSIYQAESDSFVRGIGAVVYDSAADNDTAVVACGRISGWMQHGLWTDEQYLFQPISFKYYAYFRLKISDNTRATPVCSLIIRRKENGKPFVEASRSLTGRDFSRAGEYNTFGLIFELDPRQGSKMEYAIKYLASGDSLYSDRVDVMDVTAHKLQDGAFDNTIRSITEYYGKYPALYRYYLWDEPQRDQLWASGRVHDMLVANRSRARAGGVQVLYEMDVMDIYLDSVGAGELLVDFYPLYGRTNYYGRTPVDSGDLFQKRLGHMCDFLGAARNEVKSHPGTRLWFMPQAFGHAITDASNKWREAWRNTLNIEDEGWWREPTPRELRCMIWLALAHGAKGFLYYRYHSLTEHFNLPQYDGYKDHHWIVGLTDPAGRHKRPAWFTVRDINQELNSISDVLAALTSDTVFSSNTIPADDFWIKKISGALVQIGTFHDKVDKYIIIVNRQCRPVDHVGVTLWLRNDRPVRVYDCLTEKEIYCRPSNATTEYEVKLNLAPGQGRLLRVVR